MYLSKLSLIVVLLVTAVIAVYFGMYIEHDGQRVSATDAAAQQGSDSGSAVPALPDHDSGSMRRRINEAIDAGEQTLKSIDDLDAYLQSLLDQARRQGVAGALEVEPGIAAIRRFAGELGEEQAVEKQARFTRQMQELSQLSGRNQPLNDVGVYYDEILAAGSEESRQASITGYLQAADRLPPEEQREAIAQLNTLLAGEDASSQADFSLLRYQIENAADESARQQSIRQYLEASYRLSPEQQMEANQWLNSIDR